MILITGELQTRQYTDKNGNPATWYEIIANRADFTGEKKMESTTQPPLPPEPPQYSNSSADDDIAAPLTEAPDDYPF